MIFRRARSKPEIATWSFKYFYSIDSYSICEYLYFYNIDNNSSSSLARSIRTRVTPTHRPSRLRRRYRGSHSGICYQGTIRIRVRRPARRAPTARLAGRFSDSASRRTDPGPASRRDWNGFSYRAGPRGFPVRPRASAPAPSNRAPAR